MQLLNLALMAASYAAALTSATSTPKTYKLTAIAPNTKINNLPIKASFGNLQVGGKQRKSTCPKSQNDHVLVYLSGTNLTLYTPPNRPTETMFLEDNGFTDFGTASYYSSKQQPETGATPGEWEISRKTGYLTWQGRNAVYCNGPNQTAGATFYFSRANSPFKQIDCFRFDVKAVAMKGEACEYST